MDGSSSRSIYLRAHQFLLHAPADFPDPGQLCVRRVRSLTTLGMRKLAHANTD